VIGHFVYSQWRWPSIALTGMDFVPWSGLNNSMTIQSQHHNCTALKPTKFANRGIRKKHTAQKVFSPGTPNENIIGL
jgi:hypothetical protein